MSGQQLTVTVAAPNTTVSTMSKPPVWIMQHLPPCQTQLTLSGNVHCHGYSDLVLLNCDCDLSMDKEVDDAFVMYRLMSARSAFQRYLLRPRIFQHRSLSLLCNTVSSRVCSERYIWSSVWMLDAEGVWQNIGRVSVMKQQKPNLSCQRVIFFNLPPLRSNTSHHFSSPSPSSTALSEKYLFHLPRFMFSCISEERSYRVFLILACRLSNPDSCSDVGRHQTALRYIHRATLIRQVYLIWWGTTKLNSVRLTESLTEEYWCLWQKKKILIMTDKTVKK